ncbi:hypothetical protein BC938DRAFT_481532 [Jimgerdemannia flammicorona]|uniref:Uncharacterized protein n=1 Tax=Jimgerdemannia flammicorona TaxID=994334 RepID=A0A433QG12_9FUNG|nr:hypothetical protein BC938DRAFT_481532 [Jimgerdemannia flammicorona]
MGQKLDLQETSLNIVSKIYHVTGPSNGPGPPVQVLSQKLGVDKEMLARCMPSASRALASPIYAMDWRAPGLYRFNRTFTSLNMRSNNIGTKAVAKVLETNKLSPRRICGRITSVQRPSQGTQNQQNCICRQEDSAEAVARPKTTELSPHCICHRITSGRIAQRPSQRPSKPTSLSLH